MRSHTEKRVRFAPANTLLVSPEGPLLGLRNSSSSSVGPFTPPVGVPPGVPPATLPMHASRRRVSMPAPAGASLHPGLQHTPMGPLLLYNLTDPPSGPSLSLRSRDVVRSLSRALDESATNPPVRSITINCRHLPWTIRVHASGPCGFVTVNDVLTQIYHTLRKHLSSSEYNLLGSSHDKERAGDAYRRRYRRFRDSRAYDDEKQGGMRRIDFLMDSSRFGGLTRGVNAYGEEGWMMSVMK